MIFKKYKAPGSDHRNGVEAAVTEGDVPPAPDCDP